MIADIKYQKRREPVPTPARHTHAFLNGTNLRDRPALAAEYAAKTRISDERADPAEIGDVLAAACAAQNGWKVILGRVLAGKQKSCRMFPTDDVGSMSLPGKLSPIS